MQLLPPVIFDFGPACIAGFPSRQIGQSNWKISSSGPHVSQRWETARLEMVFVLPCASPIRESMVETLAIKSRGRWFAHIYIRKCYTTYRGGEKFPREGVHYENNKFLGGHIWKNIKFSITGGFLKLALASSLKTYMNIVLICSSALGAHLGQCLISAAPPRIYHKI